jgi:hypothetical protein
MEQFLLDKWLVSCMAYHQLHMKMTKSLHIEKKYQNKLNSLGIHMTFLVIFSAAQEYYAAQNQSFSRKSLRLETQQQAFVTTQEHKKLITNLHVVSR